MYLRLLYALILVSSGFSTIFAQAPAAPQPLRLGPITFTGNIRSRLEWWDWFASDAENSYAYSGSLLRFSFGQQKKKEDWQFEVALPVLLGLPDNAVGVGAQGALGFGGNYFTANNRSRNAALPFVKQAFIRFKSLGGREAHSLRIGRMEWAEGTEVVPKSATLAAVKRDRIAHRLIGNFGFTHVQRSLDGLQYVYNTSKNNFTFMGARPTRGVFQVDGWGELNVGVFYAGYTRQVGVEKSAGELRLFGIFYDDWRENVLKTDSRPVAIRRADQKDILIATFGAHYLHALATSSGTVDLMLWGAFQTGKWGLLDHRAGSIAAELGYQPKVWPRAKPWFRGGFSYGSGDGNPNDDKHGTFFQLLPTARIYARFPFYNMMNNVDGFGEVVLRPSSRLTIRGDVHGLRLADRNDLWYQGGGAFQPWSFGFVGRTSSGKAGMATLADVSVDYQFNPKVSLGVYFGNAWGREVIQSIYPNGKNGRLAYLELGYKF